MADVYPPCEVILQVISLQVVPCASRRWSACFCCITLGEPGVCCLFLARKFGKAYGKKNENKKHMETKTVVPNEMPRNSDRNHTRTIRLLFDGFYLFCRFMMLCFVVLDFKLYMMMLYKFPCVGAQSLWLDEFWALGTLRDQMESEFYKVGPYQLEGSQLYWYRGCNPSYPLIFGRL